MMNNETKRVNLVFGSRNTGNGEVVALNSRLKQFSAYFDGDGDGATVEVRQSIDGTVEKSVVVATLTMTAESPFDFTPVMESLMPYYFTRVTAIDGGAVTVFGDF